MMGIKGRAFGPLPPVTLEELVSPDHVYRHLEDTLDLSFVRDLVRHAYASSGRPSIDPVVFFKLQRILFFEGLRSERQLMQVVADRLSLPNRPMSRSIGVAGVRRARLTKGPGTPNTMGVRAMQNYFDTAATAVVAQASTLNPGLNVSVWNLIAALAAGLSAVQLIPRARNTIKADELKGISLTTSLIISFTTM